MTITKSQLDELERLADSQVGEIDREVEVKDIQTALFDLLRVIYGDDGVELIAFLDPKVVKELI